ncbi:MAG TPA: tetratricopeptide repeat protein [Blastocatellia bacterium]|nr:tetratricopeptide repeat protein [Blastocatellia bacterium]
MGSRLKPLLKLFYNPLQAMAEIGGQSSYLAGVVLAFIASILYNGSLNRHLWQAWLMGGAGGGPISYLRPRFSPFSQIIASITPVLFIAAVFVPACLLAANLIQRRASFGVVFRQEYAPVASCVFYAWAAAHLMLLIPAWILYDPSIARLYPAEAAARLLTLRLVPLPYFVFLVVIALRSTLQLSFGRATGAVVLASFSLIALPLLPRVLLLLTSPFLLILVILLLRGVLGDALSAQRAREDYKRNLQAATLNPADASAHYNLGLVYMQRGQQEQAKSSFLRAIEIDPHDTDSHYQLGRLARQQGRLNEAINHFDAVVRLDPDHSQSEIWREIGQTYFQAGQLNDALNSFERFLERRPSDAEGRYRYGLTLHRLGRHEEARAAMQACIESVRTAPSYKYRTDKQWMNEAESFLRSQSA